jgi:hypothetical protein
VTFERECQNRRVPFHILGPSQNLPAPHTCGGRTSKGIPFLGQELFDSCLVRDRTGRESREKRFEWGAHGQRLVNEIALKISRRKVETFAHPRRNLPRFGSESMPRHRDRIPDDLKELIGLIRAGKLFAVQRRIGDGKRYRMPEGNFTTRPFRVAVETGFHSLVEVLLKAGVGQDEKDYGLSQAISHRRLDLIELLAEHGADLRTVRFDDILWTGNPVIIRWFYRSRF